MAVMPKAPTTALELLEPRDRIEPFLNTIWGPLLGVIFGVGSACTINFLTRRPVWSGIQKHVGLTLGFGVTFTYITKWRAEYYAERDAVLRHYITLHPEDFPLPERKKFGEILLPWVPIR